MKHRDAETPVNIDVIGIGASPYDHLRAALATVKGLRGEIINRSDLVLAMNASEGSEARDKSGQLGFLNKRAQWWWQFREQLDPASRQELALPPDPELKSDLCAPRWKLTPRGIQVESKDDIIKRIGRSPDKGDSCVYAVSEPRGALAYAYETSKAKKRLPADQVQYIKDDEDNDIVVPGMLFSGGGLFGGGRRRC